MPPEQVSGFCYGIDGRADVFSLGAMLYEAVALRRPFESSAADKRARQRAVLEAIATEDPTARTHRERRAEERSVEPHSPIRRGPPLQLDVRNVVVAMAEVVRHVGLLDTTSPIDRAFRATRSASETLLTVRIRSSELNQLGRLLFSFSGEESLAPPSRACHARLEPAHDPTSIGVSATSSALPMTSRGGLHRVGVALDPRSEGSVSRRTSAAAGEPGGARGDGFVGGRRARVRRSASAR
jgi:serine/threonine protein kinase